MSRSSQLPPRYRCQKKDLSVNALNYTLQSTHTAFNSSSRHHRFPSQISLDDSPILPETSPERTLLRRSASDSVAVLEDLSVLHSPMFCSTNAQDSHETHCIEKNEVTTLFETDYVYGPNSPRQKSGLVDSDSSVMSALFASGLPNSLRYSSDFSNTKNYSDSDVTRDAQPPITGIHHGWEKPPRRHSGQRSRARKLQYIAELQRTVSVLETMHAELATRVDSLSQERLNLTIENTMLKHQMTCIQKEKLIVDGQYHSLKNEVESLKATVSRHRRSRSASGLYSGSSPVDSPARSGASWQMLDMGKLSLG